MPTYIYIDPTTHIRHKLLWPDGTATWNCSCGSTRQCAAVSALLHSFAPEDRNISQYTYNPESGDVFDEAGRKIENLFADENGSIIDMDGLS